MKFVKTENLTVGMRIARPIYNKKGVLLYERDSKLTSQSLGSIKNFGLIGIFVLDPAEPCPPMTEEDMEFERFQTVQVFGLEEELKDIVTLKRTKKLDIIVAQILKNYGHLNHKINFIQNLRSSEDFVYKHSLNVAILSAMICHRMNISVEETNEIIIAALTHDIGKLSVNESSLRDLNEEEVEKAYIQAQINGFNVLENVFSATPNIKRICAQAQKLFADYKDGLLSNMKVVLGCKVLLVAEVFDQMTAISLIKEPSSEVEALRYLLDNPSIFDPKAVRAFVDSINFLNPGTGVELTSGETALVISVNPENVLRPMVLCFGSNEIIDLSNRRLYDDLEIKDILKTMDSRHKIDKSTLSKFGL